MTDSDFDERIRRIRDLADRLRVLKAEADDTRNSLSAQETPRLEAAMAMLSREVGEAAEAAAVLMDNPELVSR